MNDIVLRQEDIDRFTATLDLLNAKARIVLSVLIHKDGHLLACAGDRSLLDTTALAALVSANFSSMIAVARMVGEKEFATQHFRGEKRSVYISLVDDNTFMAAVFDAQATMDTVKVYTEEYRSHLSQHLQAFYQNVPEELPPAPDTGVLKLEEETTEVSIEELRARISSQLDQKTPKKSVEPRRLPHTGAPRNKQRNVVDSQGADKETRDSFFAGMFGK